MIIDINLNLTWFLQGFKCIRDNMKYGLMSYDYTINLGNDIQSIAARRFLPKIDYYIDHEKLNLFRSQEKVKMIMNGWYLDCLKSWPPSEDIDPLLISMHFNTSINNTKEVILSPESRNFFSSYGPVGCRDYSTLRLLEENDIDAYYSGCLTLTLDNKDSKYNSEEPFVLINVRNPWTISKYLKTKTNLPIYNIYQLTLNSLNKNYLKDKPKYYKLTSFFNAREKMFQAENFLTLYENATCVITDRIHCALPCLALKTPVLFIDDNVEFGIERLEGVTDLFIKSSFEDYKNDYSIFDVENPPKNPKDYLKLRNNLIKKTKEFTGHINDSYLVDDTNRLFKNINLLSKSTRKTREFLGNVDKVIEEYKNEVSRQNQIILEQKKTIEKLQNLK